MSCPQATKMTLYPHPVRCQWVWRRNHGVFILGRRITAPDPSISIQLGRQGVPVVATTLQSGVFNVVRKITRKGPQNLLTRTSTGFLDILVKLQDFCCCQKRVASACSFDTLLTLYGEEAQNISDSEHLPCPRAAHKQVPAPR